MNENGNITFHSPWETAKALPRRAFRAINDFIKKADISQTTYFCKTNDLKNQSKRNPKLVER